MEEIIQNKNVLHPCFNCQTRYLTRIHIPIVMECNINCLYCNRKNGCINENRPGVTNKIMNVEESCLYYRQMKEKYNENLKIVGFAGPGEILTNIEKLCTIIEHIKKEDKIDICLATNGLMLSSYAQKLLELGVKYFTVTMNAYTEKTAEKIYSYIIYNGKKLYGQEAMEILINNQKEGIKKVCEGGGVCKVNTVAINKINLDEIQLVMQYARKSGAYIGNIIPLVLLKDTIYSKENILNTQELETLRIKMEKVMPQMKHCKRCRADVAGNLL